MDIVAHTLLYSVIPVHSNGCVAYVYKCNERGIVQKGKLCFFFFLLLLMTHDSNERHEDE